MVWGLRKVLKQSARPSSASICPAQCGLKLSGPVKSKLGITVHESYTLFAWPPDNSFHRLFAGFLLRLKAAKKAGLAVTRRRI
jgi:hypothetical protein